MDDRRGASSKDSFFRWVIARSSAREFPVFHNVIGSALGMLAGKLLYLSAGLPEWLEVVGFTVGGILGAWYWYARRRKNEPLRLIPRSEEEKGK
jgi:membrane protein implicated in regulation of membrane protease activity